MIMDLSRLKYLAGIKEAVDRKIPQLPWDSNPKIGWWRNSDPLRLYHGSNLSHLDSFVKYGLNRKDSSTGMVSLAFEPFTARAFAVMGGEAEFRRLGANPKTVPENQRCVYVFDIPQSFITLHMDKDLRGNDKLHLDRLLNQQEYEEWSGTDQQYYQLCELRLNKEVPPNYLVGYMIK